KIKEENERILQEYGFCIMDNHKERIGNFRIEPPGLFRGRGDHPKMGMLKRRIRPEDIIINCSKDSKQPKPPPGTKWKEVRHDNKVTWLVSWTENIQGSIKYIMLNPSSRIKLALRAGNEKEEGETADTVGCCSLRVEHIKLYPKMDEQEYVVEFDFLGKDSIRYYNKIPVEKRVSNKISAPLKEERRIYGKVVTVENCLFCRFTSILNKHLQELMDGLTAKVFRTYNASITLQQQLKELTCPVQRIEEQLMKLQVQATDREENKQIALGTSKLNYLDPRISVAWCKKWAIPIEKIYNKTQREKFAWAIDMAEKDYEF
ncbi:hypothetical protein GOODEAATRI_015251, partial [Goodea atripinnis]